jgi:hypothetical protein
MWAAYAGHTASVRVLVEAGANKDARDSVREVDEWFAILQCVLVPCVVDVTAGWHVSAVFV